MIFSLKLIEMYLSVLMLMSSFFMFLLDTDGFVIPSLGIEESDKTKADASEVETSKPPSQVNCNIYICRCQDSFV